MPADATLTAEDEPKALAWAPACSVPALIVVAPLKEFSPERTSVPLPVLSKEDVPEPRSPAIVKVPVPSWWTMISEFAAPIWPPASVPLLEPVNRIAPEVSVRIFVDAPRLIVCAPAEVSTVRESTERVVIPFCQLNGLLNPAVVNSPAAELELFASVVSAVRRVMLPELTLARPVPLASVTKAYPSTPLGAVVVTARVPVLAELRSTWSVAAAPRLVMAPRAMVAKVPLFGSTTKILLVPAASVSPAKPCKLPPDAPTSLSVPPPRVRGDDPSIDPPATESVPAVITVEPV